MADAGSCGSLRSGSWTGGKPVVGVHDGGVVAQDGGVGVAVTAGGLVPAWVLGGSCGDGVWGTVGCRGEGWRWIKCQGLFLCFFSVAMVLVVALGVARGAHEMCWGACWCSECMCGGWQ